MTAQQPNPRCAPAAAGCVTCSDQAVEAEVTRLLGDATAEVLGFETTAPSTAMTLRRAAAEGIENFSVFCNHVTIIPAVKAILDSPDLRLDGFIGPGHVSTVIGCRPYEFIAADYGRPLVVAGFEPLDILQSVYLLMRQLRDGRCGVENQYSRVVPWEGNPVVADPKACQCGEVLKGVLKPWKCKVFGTACTPETPIGTCMVSPEGACAAYHDFGRFTRDRGSSGAAAAREASPV
jgi:hydrogenase expression/formation protein HypD